MGKITYDPETSIRRAIEQFKGAEKVPVYVEGKRADVCSLSRTPGHQDAFFLLPHFLV